MKPVHPDIKLLKDIITIEKGKMPLEQPYYGKDADLYLNPDYLRGRAVAESVKPSSNAVKVSDGEIVLLWDGSNAGEFFKSKKGILASTMSRITHSDSFNTNFLYYSLKSWESFLKGQTSGSGIPHVDKEILGKIEITQFELEEQYRIAEVLETMDCSISYMEALVEKQERIKSGLMQALLTKGIDQNGDIRSEDLHEFKDSPLGRIPVEWDVKTLMELVDEDITYGIVQAGPNFENGVPYIRTGDMSGDSINRNDLLKTSNEIAKSYKRSFVHFNDIVFALRGTVGKVLPVTEELDGANLTQGTAKISPNTCVDTTFLLWAMRTSSTNKQINLYQKGTTFMEITLNDLRKLKVSIPKSLVEQKLIAEKMKCHNDLTTQYVWEKRKLIAIKAALMQELLTGKKRVTQLLKESEAIDYES